LNAQGERLEDRLNTQDDGMERLERDIAYIRNRIDVALNGHRK
jgi:chaperonin cofactor prefoldin